MIPVLALLSGGCDDASHLTSEVTDSTGVHFAGASSDGASQDADQSDLASSTTGRIVLDGVSMKLAGVVEVGSLQALEYYPEGESSEKWSRRLIVDFYSTPQSHEDRVKDRMDVVLTAAPRAFTEVVTSRESDQSTLVYAYEQEDGTVREGVYLCRNEAGGTKLVCVGVTWRFVAANGRRREPASRDVLLRRAQEIEELPIPAPIARRPDTEKGDGIPIYVVPFYDHRGPKVRCGKFDRDLETATSETIGNTIERMTREWDELNIVSMYVAAIRLFECGHHDDAIIWFYAANIRAQLFASLFESTEERRPGTLQFELTSAHSAFQQLGGQYINEEVFADKKKAKKLIQKSMDLSSAVPKFEKAYPTLKLRDTGKWDEKLAAVLDNYGEMLDWLDNGADSEDDVSLSN
ncbi:hypothetical protein GC176_23315 [bacterium]|nr:hypothetical protein [bacterium]